MTTCSVDHLATRPGGPNSIDPGLDEWWLLEMPPSSGSYFLLCRSHPWPWVHDGAFHLRVTLVAGNKTHVWCFPIISRAFFDFVSPQWLKLMRAEPQILSRPSFKFPATTCKYRGFGHFLKISSIAFFLSRDWDNIWTDQLNAPELIAK